MKINRRIYFKSKDFYRIRSFFNSLKILLDYHKLSFANLKRIASREFTGIIYTFEQTRADQLRGDLFYGIRVSLRKQFLTELQLVECCILLEDIKSWVQEDNFEESTLQNFRERLDALLSTALTKR